MNINTVKRTTEDAMKNKVHYTVYSHDEKKELMNKGDFGIDFK